MTVHDTLELQSKVIETKKIKWKDLQFIQQDEFKEWIGEGDEKLINSLLKYQFVDPFKVWKDEESGTLYCLDGKHRWLDLHRIESLGAPVPEELEATFIDCADIGEAAELVLVYSSVYAKITQQGLFDFVSKFDLDAELLESTISIPEFSMKRFEQKFDIDNLSANNDEERGIEHQMEAIVKEGDIFELNGHRLICGSFRDEDAVARLMGQDKARIVNCDPPYNLPASFFSNNGNTKHKDFAEGGGEMSDDEFVKFLAVIMQRSVDYTLPGAIHYIFMDFRHSWHMTEAARLVYGKPEPKQVCIWNKDVFANGSFYRAKHELCFIFENEGAKALWQKDLFDEGGEFYKDNNEWCFIFKNGDGAKHLSHLDLKDRIRSNVWNYPSSFSTSNPDRLLLKNHPTPKPLEMIADSILDTTNKGDKVIDWFLGSGTALIACEKTGREGRFTEIEPLFVQLAIIRWINYCEKYEIDISFTHVNGKLTIDEFKRLSNTIHHG